LSILNRSSTRKIGYNVVLIEESSEVLYWRTTISKFSRLTKISFLLAFFFAVDKALAIFRVVVILRLFGLSSLLDLDAFNVANNVPDLLFALISGGALAMAFIPVLTEVLSKSGKKSAWELFSRVANFAFLVTLAIGIIVAIFAKPFVSLVIAPGFSPGRQLVVVQLMRLNLIATIIFSISGLVIAGLQSNQRFLLPALAPIFYNIGQIIGVAILAPVKGLTIGGFTFPALGLGVNGMVYGVILGAILHLGIQIPGLIANGFHWSPSVGLKDPEVKKVLKLLGPRVLTMFFIQLTFVVRDNLASHLSQGDISALTYGWMIQQVPETLIGTAIGTAMLPTISALIAAGKKEMFLQTIHRALRVLIALTIPISVILSLSLSPFLNLAFSLGEAGTRVLLAVTQGFLIGLMGHSLLEVASRSFYAQQDAKIPLYASALNAALYTAFGIILMKPLGAMGISVGDSVSFSIEAFLLLGILNYRMSTSFEDGKSFRSRIRTTFSNINLANRTFLRTVLGSIVIGGVLIPFQLFVGKNLGQFVNGASSMLLGVVIILPFIWVEIRQLFQL
jgi:putative peptidoglycan lipid II flippase